MNRNTLILKLDILTPWLCGSGRTGGRLFDAVPVKDAEGLPYVPGRHLKGLVRSALERSAPMNLEGVPVVEGADLARLLFGAASEEDDRDYMPEAVYFGGLLRASSAELCAADCRLASPLTPSDRENVFYLTQQSTAIGDDGTAKDKSLRVSQLAVPLTLYAELSADLEAFEGTASRADDLLPWEAVAIKSWASIIRHALPLVRAVGAHRQRGFGRAILSVDGDYAS